ncbi:Pkinase-domain-containing protein [Basidiobolus meristosporus CBS 931.73]|uniref:Pkinase-domain-containing protein n=1 Tax=Basidiobolus meristosporus CBS 931.73 TaxID=1314790 RepID=A0A1Y1XF59_9FUNG|nr:Pkinase-domain-containing protein [Basidiobolus meristosporus CBS 931.73]|eukprot:ORX83994.1 Pkinase-domain-containing protein [Basidiobolus meristosporus CBS 931.73]
MKTSLHQELSNDQSERSLSSPVQMILKNYKFKSEFLTKYSIGAELGSGGFGFVTNGYRRVDNQEVAIKFILKEKIPPQSWVHDAELGDMPMEVYLLKNLRHENIVRFFDFFEDAQYVYLVMEYHGSEWAPAVKGGLKVTDIGDISYAEHPAPIERPRLVKRQMSCDLFECIEQCNRLPENIAKHIFRQLVSCLGYLHSRGVCHRDIKDENIVIDSNYNIKLIDFGSSIILPRRNCYLNRFCGTITYASPEILLGQAYRPEPAEIWSLGVLLYTILYGQTPFANPVQAIHHSYTHPKVRSSIACLDLLDSMLEKDYRKRVTIQEILDHPWIKYDLVY